MHGALRFHLTALLSATVILGGLGLFSAGCASGGTPDTGVRVDAPMMDVPTTVDTGVRLDTPGPSCLPACSGTEMCCGGACVDTSNNANHCGECGNRCEVGSTCVDGECGSACTPACDLGETCTGGVCRCGAAATCAGTASCCGGGCVDTQTNPNHCGVCGRACSAGQTCQAGSCTTATCTPSCAAGETCVMGMCLCGGTRCAAGQGCCGGVCSPLNTPINCGACGRTCGASDDCCGGVCRNTSSDENNCGGCGNTCGSTADGCTSGNCTCGGGSECLIACLIGTCVPL